MRPSVAVPSVLALMFGAIAVGVADDVPLTDVLLRQKVDTIRSVLNEEPAGGEIVRHFDINRTDEFSNGSGDYIVMIDGVEVLPLDPEDVGFSTISGQLEGPTNYHEVMAAAASMYPDVSYWGANWEPGQDPAHVAWQPVGAGVVWLSTGEATSFPVTLGPGESFHFYSGYTTSDTVPETPNPGLLNGELVAGFTVSGSVALIPEPGTFGLLGVGAVGLLIAVWQRRRR